MQCFPRRAASSIPRPACVSLRRRSFYGRGWIKQAALLKTAHWAVFAPSSATGPQLFESTRLASGKVITKQKLQYPVRILEFLVGAGGFEPPKLKSSRFTVCPHWPLGNTPIFFCVRRADCLYILPRAKQFVNHLQQILSQFLHQSLQQTRPMEKPPGNQCSRAVFLGAGDRS